MKRRDGFSILEVLIVMAIFGSVLLAATSLRGNLDTLQNLVGQKLQSRGDIAQTLQIFVTELRSAGPSSLGAYPVAAAATSSITFYSDIDKDGIFERVRYFLATSTINKGVIEPTGNPLTYATTTEVVVPVVDNVIPQADEPLFTYYGPDYTGGGSEAALTPPISITDVRIVQTAIYADVNPEVAPTPVFFSDTVNIRNLRSN